MNSMQSFGAMLLLAALGSFTFGAETAAKSKDTLDPAAAWQAGLVHLDDQWMKADDAGQKLANDPLYKIYCQKRDALVDTADHHRELARWCQKHHLTAEARIHWQKVLEFEKQDAEAIAGLGLELHNGRLLCANQLKAEKVEDQKLQKAVQTWRPKINKWRTAIERGTPEQAAQALDELKQLDDPYALPVLEQVFTNKISGAKGLQLATLLVQTAGRIEDPEEHADSAPPGGAWPGQLAGLRGIEETSTACLRSAVGGGHAGRAQNQVPRGGLARRHG